MRDNGFLHSLQEQCTGAEDLVAVLIQIVGAASYHAAQTQQNDYYYGDDESGVALLWLLRHGGWSG